MIKTPVTILQELMMKRNSLPQYELLHTTEGLGTHLPTFYYKVTAFSVSATGHARSKKDAKHEAARNALEKLQEIGIYHPAVVPTRLPPTSPWKTVNEPVDVQIDVKAVAELQELCYQQNLPEPEFLLIHQEGPPHCPQFTIECKIGNMMATSVSTTKKKAKHVVALKLLERLKGMLPEAIEEMQVQTKQLTMSKDDIANIFSSRSTLNRKKVTNWSRMVSTYKSTLRDIMDKQGFTYDQLWQDADIKTEAELKAFLNRLNIEYEVNFISSDTSKFAFIRICTEPEFDIFGEVSDGCVTGETINKVVEFLKIMTA